MSNSRSNQTIHKVSAPEELSFNVNDLTISAQKFGQTSSNKYICLHGWLDNSASFSLLSSHLKDAEIISLDLAGHGRSSHRSAHGTYNIWDDIIDILSIIDLLNWKNINLIGHSRGGIVAILLTIAVPELFNKLILLDSIMAINNKNKDAPDTLRDFLLDHKKLNKRKKKIYSNKNTMIEKRMSNMFLSKEEIRAMMDRAIDKHGDNAFSWVHDPRLLGSSALKLNKIHINEFLNKFNIQTLLIKAENGILKNTDLTDFEARPNVRSVTNKGSHHMHLELDKIKKISKLISDFISENSIKK